MRRLLTIAAIAAACAAGGYLGVYAALTTDLYPPKEAEA